MTDPSRPSPIEKAWARALLSIVSGVALALAFPNASITVLAFFALTPVIIVAVRSPGWWGAVWAGWITITVTWLINVPWVIAVMSEQGGLPLPAGIAIFTAMCAILGIYGSAFTLLVWLLRLGRNPLPWLIVPLLWIVVEYARTYLLTGFAWNLLAVTIVDHPFVQIAPWVGPYVLGAMIVVPTVAAAWLLTNRPAFNRAIGAIVAVGIYLTVWGAIGVVLLDVDDAHEAGELRVAAIQPNIPLETRWDPENTIRIFELMREMTVEGIEQGAETVVWPESTVPLTYAMTDFYRDWVEVTSEVENVDIILGSIAEDPDDADLFWNSAYLVREGETTARYDKIRLVPFGEYVPLRKMLFFAEKLVRAVGEFQFGTSDEPLAGNARYGPAICYEVVFPQIVSEQVRNGADLLVTITNDSWFGESSAQRQHLDGARLGAIETRRWMVRAATTGISAIVDPAGRIVEIQPSDTRGILVHEVKRRSGITPYVRYGDVLAIVGILLAAVAVVLRSGALTSRLRRTSAG
ncbi:MAG: apolipoprotein N-acyltransferase [Thermoanaerobaculia bacterium]|nr:apolipoprotein N-acyltransferase [Thermoanaerobaculia bacterium]